MNYQLYWGSYGGTLWGDGTTGSTFTQNVTANTKCTSGTQVFTVGSLIYGVIPMQQPVSAGTYGDTLTISITP
jgi:spore coat protein U-like protein